MSEWLVPVSPWVRFVGRGGRAVDASFDAIQAEALRGDLDRIVCEVRGPLVDARPGDLVWCFVPESDIGVVAVGRAKAPTKGKQPAFAVTVDRARTRVLASDPLPAPTIRRWVPELRQGSVRLDPRPRALTVLDGWLRERSDRDVEMLATLPASPWRSTASRAGDKGLALAGHDVVGPIARMLRSQDFALGLGKGAAASPSDEPRIIARRVRDVVVLDVCRIPSGRGRAEALTAIGPLLETKWRLERARRDVRLRVSPWVAFSSRPHAEVCAFIEESDLLVSWTHRGGVVELTDRSKQRWYQYLGVR